MRLEAFWHEVEAGWGLLSAIEVLKTLGLAADGQALVRDLRKRGQLLVVERGLDHLYPGFQFTDDGAVEPVIPDLIRLASEVGWSQNDLVVWLCSPSGYFSGDRPVAHLHETERLLDNARDEATVDW